MNYFLYQAMAYSILIGGILGMIRFHQIGPVFRPFVYMLWVGGINEMISNYLILNGQYNIINTNIYSLVESFLLLWFFQRMGLFDRARWLLFILAGAFGATWILESFFLRASFGEQVNSYFMVLYSFPVVLLSITAINDLITTEKDLLRNARFLICIGLVIYFTYHILVEIFWLYGLTANAGTFRSKVYRIMFWINLLSNLIYGLAVLWMRKKQAFSLQY